MITLYTGTPGSGKSLHLIQLILRCLGWGREVICNFPLKFTDKHIKKGYDKRFYYYTNEQLTVNSLIEFAIDHDYFERKKESQCLVVIDEAGGKYNTRDFQSKDRTEWIDFFSQHRKAGFDFILVAQLDRMIDRQIRGLIETEKVHRKINNFGPFAILPFPVFVCIEKWYVAGHRVGSEFFLYHKKYGERYDSMKMFEGFKLSEELLKKIEKKKLSHSTEEIDRKVATIQDRDIYEKVNISDVPITAIYEGGSND